MDWLHAVLHKLEGDFRNAKMWYTDLGNNNAGALEGLEEEEASKTEQGTAGKFRRFHEFWFVPSANGGVGERAIAQDLQLDKAHNVARDLKLTAHGHTDLVFLTALACKATSSKAVSSESVKQEVEKHHSSTTISEGKIKDSQSAFSLDELHFLYYHLSQHAATQTTVSTLTKLELIWMLDSLVQDFGWRKYGMAETVQALKLESTPAHKSVDEERKSKASNMVLNPGQGQRKF